jgi:hypothetical protein
MRLTNPLADDPRWPLLALVGAGVALGIYVIATSGSSSSSPSIAGATNTGGGGGGGTVPFSASAWQQVPTSEASSSAAVGDQVTLYDSFGLSYTGTVTAVNYGGSAVTYNVQIASAPGPSAAGGGTAATSGETVTGVPIAYIDDYGSANNT